MVTTLVLFAKLGKNGGAWFAIAWMVGLFISAPITAALVLRLVW
jgi:hypothetical protein